MSTRSTKSGTLTPARQIAGFIARFDPAIARLIRTTRAAVRRRFPTAIELVYDNYNALAFGFCTTGRASDCLVAVAAFPRGVALSFYWGATLPDPHRLLQGRGKQNRFLRVTSAVELRKPAVAALLKGAVAQARTPPPRTGHGRTIIQSVSAKQRPRRPRTKG